MEHTEYAHDEKENLNDGESHELPPAPARQGDEGVNSEKREEEPAKERFELVTPLPGVEETLGERECDPRRGHDRSEAHNLKPGNKLAISGFDGTVGEYRATNARQKPQPCEYSDALPERHFGSVRLRYCFGNSGVSLGTASLAQMRMFPTLPVSSKELKGKGKE